MKNKLIPVLLFTLYVFVLSCSKESENPWADPLWGEITVIAKITQPNTTITINILSENYSINWKDKNNSLYGKDRKHIYKSVGTYSITISGKNITRLTCTNQPEIISVNTSKCSTLSELFLSATSLTQLDVSQNYSLQQLSCTKSSLNFLTTGSITHLRTVSCYENQLTQLDIKNGNSIKELYCSDNLFTSLDLTKYSQLELLSCNFCDQLTTLDVSKNNNLQTLQCSNNKKLTQLQFNAGLCNLFCSDNQLTSLNLMANQKLESLDCSHNEITALDLSQCISLKRLVCKYNQLSQLDVTNCSLLDDLSCSYNQLNALDLSHNKNLNSLYCTNNQLSVLDLSENRSPYFENMDCRYNPLEYIWVWKGASIGPYWYIPSFAWYRPK